MKKLILKGEENDGYRFHYRFEKNENFKKIFLRLMKNFGFKDRDLKYAFEGYDGKNDIAPLKVKKIVERIDFFRNKSFDVELIYMRRIHLIIRTKKIKELRKIVNKYFEFI